ncbi:TonB-dependent receptor plug domain-containing protein, partial [Steroidobacter sp.]|uniref:TonB-dependent receptor plug domain-containing protein n=1 Tax=Steroidobacter sp. TaxID=1978227 RepID=UPI001A5B83DB
MTNDFRGLGLSPAGLGRASAVAALVIGTAPAWSQQVSGPNEAEAHQNRVEEIMVMGSRLPTELTSMPISVNVIGEEEISKQLGTTQDLQAVLAQLVPGLSLSNQATVNTYTSLRGRKPVILVDGVLLTSTLNDVSRELSELDP